jgi:hypothetical protein
MEAAGLSETSMLIRVYQTTCRHTPENRNIEKKNGPYPREGNEV